MNEPIKRLQYIVENMQKRKIATAPLDVEYLVSLLNAINTLKEASDKPDVKVEKHSSIVHGGNF